MKRVAGLPLWMLMAGVAGVGGLWWYRRRQAATAATAAAQTAATAAQPTAAPGGTGDPFLVAYQAGEASGVSTYQAGVTSGISLVDSILGMFPPSGLAAGGTSSSAGAAFTPPTNLGALTGSGYGVSKNGQPVVTPSGTYEGLSGGAFKSAVLGGQTTYYEAAPGVFLPDAGPNVIDPATKKPAIWGSNPLGLEPGTPQYINVGA